MTSTRRGIQLLCLIGFAIAAVRGAKEHGYPALDTIRNDRPARLALEEVIGQARAFSADQLAFRYHEIFMGAFSRAEPVVVDRLMSPARSHPKTARPSSV